MENALKETYYYTLGNLTIPVSGKGEVVIYDLDSNFTVSTLDVLEDKNYTYPNPINSELPLLPHGLYWLRGNADGERFKIFVLGQ